ncbi:MAG: hypothetical protein ACK40A_12610, partial [Pannonibacter indicus]
MSAPAATSFTGAEGNRLAADRFDRRHVAAFANGIDGLVAVLGYVFTMVTGGNDTTTGLLGGAVQLLADAPEERARLVSGEVP